MNKFLCEISASHVETRCFASWSKKLLPQRPVGEPPMAIIFPRSGSPQKVTGQNASLQIVNVETLHCNVSMWGRGAFSGAQSLLTSGADLIAGLRAQPTRRSARGICASILSGRGTSAALERCSSPRPERYCAIARRLAARPKY